MVRAERKDTPGSWHHVVNRGVERRSIFAGPGDYRFFLSRLARVSRLGLLELHAYCLLQNHFHLLVRSPAGELAQAMRLVQNAHSRYFNRRYKRDGPLFRGRFVSRPIESEIYWWTVLRYIDFNAVEARIVARPEDYPFGSACHYVRSGPRPRWLFRRRVERAVMGHRLHPFDPARYLAALGSTLTPNEVEIVDRRLASPCRQPDPLDRLVGTGTESFREWKQRDAQLANGQLGGLTVATAGTILEVIRAREHRQGPWIVGSDRSPVSAWAILACGLLRSACNLALLEVAIRLECAESSVHRRTTTHLGLVASDEEYAAVSAEILRQAIRIDFAPACMARDSCSSEGRVRPPPCDGGGR